MEWGRIEQNKAEDNRIPVFITHNVVDCPYRWSSTISPVPVYMFMPLSHQEVVSVSPPLKNHQALPLALANRMGWIVLFMFWRLALKRSGIFCYCSEKDLSHHVRKFIYPSERAHMMRKRSSYPRYSNWAAA